MTIKELHEQFIVKQKEDGIVMISKKTNKVYELLEMVGLNSKRNSTSDIVAIWETGEGGYKNLVNYCFGTECDEDTYTHYAQYILDWENGVKTDLQHSLYNEEDIYTESKVVVTSNGLKVELTKQDLATLANTYRMELKDTDGNNYLVVMGENEGIYVVATKFIPRAHNQDNIIRRLKEYWGF